MMTSDNRRMRAAFRPDTATWLDRRRNGTLHVTARLQEPLNLVGDRQGTAGAKRPAVQRGARVGIIQHILERAVGRAQAPGRERAAKHVAGPGAVDAVHREARRADFAAVAARQASVLAKRDANDRRAEF